MTILRLRMTVLVLGALCLAAFGQEIAPGGKFLYQTQGEVDIVALRRVILANLENETYVGHPAYWAAK
jgi:hypothetical protein